MNKYIRIASLLLMGQILSAAGLAAAAMNDGNSPGSAFYSSVPTAYMDDPRRVEWQKPEQVIEHLLIKQGDMIADVGAGTGYFTMMFAKKTGKSGMVYAVDIDEDMVKRVDNRARKEGLNNVKSVLAQPDNPMLPKTSLDLVFMCDTYLFLENRGQYLLRLRDSLKKDGRLAIVSFNRNAEIPGAPPAHQMISRQQTVQEMEKAGFTLAAEYFFLPFQDFLVFVKSRH